jgi:hypothetical protein
MSVFSNRYSDAKQEAGDYTQAVLDLLGDRDPMQVLEGTPARLTKVIGGLSAADLAHPEAPGKWSMLQVLCHLVDSEIVWAYRVRRILAEDRPNIEGYDQDLWAQHLAYDRADVTETLDEIRAIRRGNLHLMRRLGPDTHARVGVHTERGEESIGHLIRMYAGHDILHMNQLERIRQSLNASTRS